jgi:hypothetical protein
MYKYRVYRPNMSEYHTVTGTKMAVTNDGVAIIYDGDTVVAVIPKIVPVILEQN